jgi:hypothetical protein
MEMSSVRALRPGALSDPASPPRAAEKRHLYGPVVDFLCLGGASLLLLPVVLALPEDELSPLFGVVFLALANVINHPHFAFSYQVFYEGFRRKAFGADSSRALRARYVFAGIVVPAALAAFFSYCMISGDVRTLGYGANAMGFLVGWHYVKQGYGMLMVDAALKRRFFADADKKILRINAYVVWALAWLAINSMLQERSLWGIRYYMVPVPRLVLAAAFCLCAATTAMSVVVLARKWRADGGSLPASGVAAYVASLYLWLLFMHWNVLWLWMVPALHSLQYLTVVARYRMNRLRDGADADERPRPALLARLFRRRCAQRYAGFVVLGVALGYAGFWGAPELLQAVARYDHAALGATAFLFVFWVFINVHHYFLDNVMWRSENPDVRRYLFA